MGTGMREKPLKASEIIEMLKKLIEEHGDGPVYSVAEYQDIYEIYWCEKDSCIMVA